MTGFIIAYKPQIITEIPASITAYQMIEKRIIWGTFIGIGIFLLFNNHWKVGLSIIYALLFFLILGIIIARFLGLLLDGYFPKQLLWLVIEIIILVAFAFLYWKCQLQG